MPIKTRRREKATSVETEPQDSAISIRINSDSVTLSDTESEIVLSLPEAQQIGKVIRDQIGLGDESEEHAILFFTNEIESESVEHCQRQLLKLAFELMELPTEEREGKYITLVINSPGGCCDDGMALIDTIEMVRGIGIPVVGIVMGAAYSMAAVILQACSVRLVGRHARVMLHEVSSGAEGKLSEIRAAMKQIDVVNEMTARVFGERNTKGHNEQQFWVNFIEGHDKYLNPEECVSLGLADDIYQPLQSWRVDVGQA